jgi:hypothetical protein
MKNEGSHLDPLIKEMLSFQLYKRGKQPLEGVDPKDRIKRSIWRDDGIDLDLLIKEGFRLSREMEGSGILIHDEVMVKEGLFRKRRPHRIMKAILPLDDLINKIRPGGKEMDPGQIGMLLDSELLFPVLLFRSYQTIRESLTGISMARSVQKEVMDISPRSAVRMLLQTRKVQAGEDDLLKLFDRQVEEKYRIKTGSGSAISDLRSLISVVLSSSDGDIQELMESGRILDLARDGFRSPRLEGLFKDLSLDENGDPEKPGRFRIRLGRAMMESEAAGEVFSKIAVPLLERFRSCSKSEASRLRGFLGPLMGLRASPILSDLVFSVPSKNRPFIIDLMGETSDGNLVETLKRIEGFSSVDEDRKAAKNAIEKLGGS